MTEEEIQFAAAIIDRGKELANDLLEEVDDCDNPDSILVAMTAMMLCACAFAEANGKDLAKVKEIVVNMVTRCPIWERYGEWKQEAGA